MSTNKSTETNWSNLILKYEKRTSSISEFCKEYNISRSSLYKWRNYFDNKQKTAIANQSTESKNFVPVTIDKSSSKINESKSSVPQNNISSMPVEKFVNSSSVLKIRKSDLTIEFANGYSLLELKAILGLINAAK